MFVRNGLDFPGIYDWLVDEMKRVPRVDNQRWQGIDVSKDPSAKMYEMRNVAIQVPLEEFEDLDHWRYQCQPNLPWADDHFLERVGREPLNPGVQWANWPWASSADRHRKDQIFNHTYMERLWPTFARMTPEGKYDPTRVHLTPRRGIAHIYGDLDSLVNLFIKDPFTRQAWIPLFFPEDTGWGDGGRKPCTLGYQLIRRGDHLNMFYPLRSCDLVRHYRDDCYLAVRLLLWVLNECRKKDPSKWNVVKPGDYSMWMTSLHCFENDRRTL